MTPKQLLEHTTRMIAELEKAKKLTLKVGLPSDKVGSKIYGDGSSIMTIGAGHEYGTSKMPARSFLRVPFEIKSGDIDSALTSEFAKVLDGRATAADALGRVGIVATNISKEAFRTNGFGMWPALAESTKKIKLRAGKTTPLIWSGILRNSVTWSVE